MRLILSIIILFYSHNAYTQSVPDTLLSLPSIIVKDSTVILGRNATVTIKQADLQSYRSQSVADVLNNEGLAFIKSYGVGSLATPSVRGGAAGQTAVFWNDLPIQSPMLGLLDLALLPANGLGSVALVYGGHSSEWGSGAVSGGIHLKSSQPSGGFNADLHTSYGSFEQRSQQAHLSYGKEKWGLSAGVQWDDAQNDFPFQIRADLPEKRLSNAEFDQRVSQQQFFWQPSARHRFELNSWQQHTERNLPPTTVQNRSLASQSDRIWRQVLQWQGTGQKAIWQGRAAYFREELIYQDGLIGLVSPSNFDTYLLRLDRSQSWRSSWLFKTGVHYQYANALADGYEKQQTQTQIALYQRAKFYFYTNWSASATARLEQVQGGQSIPAFDLQLNHQISTKSLIYASWSRDFRLPTLNDQFWAAGGNPDLATEFAWNQSLGYKGKNIYKTSAFLYEIDLFNRRVENWIQWSQREGDSFWSAGNIAEVWSRGVSTHLKWTQKKGKAHLTSELRHQWVKSTYETTISSPNIPKGTQLWYTPEHQLSGLISYRRPQWQLSYQQQWTGATNGINDDLAAYAVANVRWEWRLDKRLQATLFAQCNNVWNTQYRVIERRPMPGRNFRLGLSVSIFENVTTNTK